jgi:hypothetical protein
MKNAFVVQNLNSFFITICNINQDNKVKINGFLFSREFRSFYEKVKWNVIEKISPWRKQESDNNLFITPLTQNANFILDAVIKTSNSTYNEKPELSQNSFFATQEGKEFLKNEFSKIQNDEDCRDAEIILNGDKTISLTFKMGDKEFEIRYPDDFSKENPNQLTFEKKDGKVVKTYPLDSNPEKVHFIRPTSFFSDLKKFFDGF